MLQTQLSSCSFSGEGPRASPHSVGALWTGSLCKPLVTRGSSQSSLGASTPVSGIQITPLNCVLLPNPSCLPSRLIWPWQVQKCLEAEAMLPLVHAYTVDSVTWRPWKWSGLPQTIRPLLTCSEITQFPVFLEPLLATHIFLAWILTGTKMSLGALASLCWSKLVAST